MNAGTPSITIAMSVYNNAPHLAQAISAMLAQTHTDFEFLIVDDGSTDDSGAIIDAFAEQDGRIRPIHQENRGLVASLNRMIHEARAPLIARMDGDDDCHPERLARQYRFMLDHPDHGALGTQSISFDDAGNRWASPEFPTSDAALRAAMASRNVMCHPSVVMRRAAVLDVGGYRGQFVHCEDRDLWLRLSERTKLASLSDALTYYRRSPGQVSNRHIVAQAIGAAMAWLAHEERQAGRADPFDGMDRLPPVGDLDGLLGRSGAAASVREMALPQLIYTPVGLSPDVFGMVLDQIREGGTVDQAWRLVARLVKFGQPARALRLAGALLRR
ncbi:glycosyltransferase [Emcibacter sp. SYSU 3D8]|uniref:glycosyltransferase family 2 protein n=1 Tax=Emcibacter sp. SYSU 3D8 TaxID=3133969 RepID=UPI0031FF39EE